MDFQRLPVEREGFTTAEIDDPDATYFFIGFIGVIGRGARRFERPVRDKRNALSIGRPLGITVVARLRERQQLILASRQSHRSSRKRLRFQSGLAVTNTAAVPSGESRGGADLYETE